MSKPPDRPVGKQDIVDFLDKEADFSFEMKVLETLRHNTFQCDHAGTFVDPITEKTRQFDIRARHEVGVYRLRLAVECKNLRPTAPLLVHAVNRRDHEAFQQLLIFARGYPMARAVNVEGPNSVYRPGEPVGKQTDQVARKSGGDFLTSDAPIFDKISQSVNSAHDLVREAASSTGVRSITAMVPVLVVPDGQLWQVQYDDDGRRVSDPVQVPHTTLYLNKRWTVILWAAVEFTLSHLDIITLGALSERVQFYTGDKGFFFTRESVLPRA
jgi:hypothetical protein